MTYHCFERPILNSPYDHPAQHWELDEDGQPTNRILEVRRSSKLITPVPKPRKRRRKKGQQELLLDSADGLSSPEQGYTLKPIINEIRSHVDSWRQLPNPNDWQVTPETARLLQHWRHHRFQDIRPFFCQVEAVETATWLTEVAPKLGPRVKTVWEHLKGANEQANPALLRIALNSQPARVKLPSWPCSLPGRPSTRCAIRKARPLRGASCDPDRPSSTMSCALGESKTGD